MFRLEDLYTTKEFKFLGPNPEHQSHFTSSSYTKTSAQCKEAEDSYTGLFGSVILDEGNKLVPEIDSLVQQTIYEIKKGAGIKKKYQDQWTVLFLDTPIEAKRAAVEIVGQYLENELEHSNGPWYNAVSDYTNDSLLTAVCDSQYSTNKETLVFGDDLLPPIVQEAVTRIVKFNRTKRRMTIADLLETKEETIINNIDNKYNTRHRLTALPVIDKLLGLSPFNSYTRTLDNPKKIGGQQFYEHLILDATGAEANILSRFIGSDFDIKMNVGPAAAIVLDPSLFHCSPVGVLLIRNRYLNNLRIKELRSIYTKHAENINIGEYSYDKTVDVRNLLALNRTKNLIGIGAFLNFLNNTNTKVDKDVTTMRSAVSTFFNSMPENDKLYTVSLSPYGSISSCPNSSRNVVLLKGSSLDDIYNYFFKAGIILEKAIDDVNFQRSKHGEGFLKLTIDYSHTEQEINKFIYHAEKYITGN